MELTAQKEKVTGENGPVTALELGTYALMQSFSHASYGDRSRSFVRYCSNVLYCIIIHQSVAYCHCVNYCMKSRSFISSSS